MEKFFTNKSIWKKIVVAILIVMSFKVLTPLTAVYAAPDDSAQEGDNIVDKGILMRPIMSLLVSAGDGIMYVMNSAIMGGRSPLIHIPLIEDFGFIINTLIRAAKWVANFATDIYYAFNNCRAQILNTLTGTNIGDVYIVFADNIRSAVSTFLDSDAPDDLYLPNYDYTPEEIFKGNILLFNVNFFEGDIILKVKFNDDSAPMEVTGENQSEIDKEAKNHGGIKYYFYEKDNKEIITSKVNSTAMLKNTVSRWYVALRNICIVGMLSVLIYIGIRMLLTTVASDKAKYKEMLKDWFVGLCLLFVMHYIMAFSVTLVEKLTDMVAATVDNNLYTTMIFNNNGEKSGIQGEKQEKLLKGLEEYKIKDTVVNEDGSAGFWDTDLMGSLRLKIQVDKNGGLYIGEIICFLVLVIFTVIFTFTYLRRVLYMAFLTIIAPLVALTYSIDKINDGQAQGFNTWIKEYIFNLLLQPMHLLLYFILITSAFELAGSNVIYSIVAIGFMLPAEKLLRRIFGFEKAHTPPFLGGPLGASLAMQGVNKLSSFARGGKAIAGQTGRSRSNDNSDSNTHVTRTKTVPTMKTLAGNAEEDKEKTDSSTRSREKIQGDLDAVDALENDIVDDDNMDYLIAERERLENEKAGLDGTRDSATALPENNTIRTIDDVQADLAELDALENDIVDDDNMDYLIAERERLENEMARLNAIQPDSTNVVSNSDSLDQTRPMSRTENNNEKRPTTSRMRRLANSRVGKAVGRRGKATLAAGKVALKNAPRKMGRTAWKATKGIVGGAAVGGAIAGLGLAAAVASGDTKNLITAAGTATGAGYAGARRAANSTFSSHISQETRDAFNEVYHGEEYREQDVAKASKEARKDQMNRIKAEQAFKDSNFDSKIQEAIDAGASREEVREMRREQKRKDKETYEQFMGDEGHYDQMIKAGVTDIDRAIVLEKGIQEGVYKDVDDAVAHSQLYDQFGQKDPTKMGAKDQSNFNKTLHNGLESNGIKDEKVISRKTKEITDGLSFLHKGLND